MESNLNQALQQAIAAHREGRLQDAERLYRAILQTQPNHPDANHNLGVLAVAVGKPLEAVPFFKQAVEVNPEIEQFWLSYIDVLIKLERFDEAKRVLVEGEKSASSSDKLDAFKPSPRGTLDDIAKAAKGQTLTGKRKKLAENKKSKKRKPQPASLSAEPSQDLCNHLLNQYQTGRFHEAEALAKSITQEFPQHLFGWKLLGAVFKKMGRLEEALAAMQSVVKLSPQDVEGHNNLGITLKALGRLDEAEAIFRRVLDLKPHHVEAHNNWGNTLKKLGRLDEAETSYRKAINLKPDYAQAHYNLGNTMRELGKLEEAEASFRRAISAQPDFAEAHCNLGVTLKELGNLDACESSYRKAISLKPDFAEAHNNLGDTLKELGRLYEAEASYRKAINLKPDYVEARYNLGNTLREVGKLEEAEASFRRAISAQPDFAEAHNNLGVTLKELGKLDACESSYKKAISLKPDFAEAHNNVGIMLQELGKLDEAQASFRKAIALKPDYAEAYRNLANTMTFSSEDEHLFHMQVLYRDPAISDKNRCHICFALARAAEDLEDCGAAFQFYEKGNALRKKQLGYDKAQDSTLFTKLKATYPQISSYPLAPGIVAPQNTPLFIIGMLRSGTTLVEQIISSHPMVTGAGELPLVSQYGRSVAIGQTPVDTETLTTFREQYLNSLQQHSEGRAIVTDKMPQNFRFLGLITTALPEAQIIHIKRDSAAVCWANYTQYFVSSVGYCYSLDDILHYYELYEDLMSYWHQALPNRIYDLDYERLTANPEEETRKLIGHLGLEWDDACLSPEKNARGVATASNVQIRKKVYQGSSERWKRYRPYLNGVLDQLSAKK